MENNTRKYIKRIYKLNAYTKEQNSKSNASCRCTTSKILGSERGWLPGSLAWPYVSISNNKRNAWQSGDPKVHFGSVLFFFSSMPFFRWHAWDICERIAIKHMELLWTWTVNIVCIAWGPMLRMEFKSMVAFALINCGNVHKWWSYALVSCMGGRNLRGIEGSLSLWM